MESWPLSLRSSPPFYPLTAVMPLRSSRAIFETKSWMNRCNLLCFEFSVTEGFDWQWFTRKHVEEIPVCQVSSNVLCSAFQVVGWSNWISAGSGYEIHAPGRQPRTSTSRTGRTYFPTRWEMNTNWRRGLGRAVEWIIGFDNSISSENWSWHLYWVSPSDFYDICLLFCCKFLKSNLLVLPTASIFSLKNANE